jgi:hypothetical protein
MATNEYLRGIKVPLTVGASVPARTPVCVGKIPGVTLTPTGASGTQIATCLLKGIVDLLVDSACDAVTLALASVTNGQTLIFNGFTFTAHTSATTWSTRTYNIGGTDAQDATLLCKMINGGKIVTLLGVSAGDTVTVNGLVFTAHGTTTTVANREFSVAGTDTQDAAELVTCLTDGTYGVPGCIATVGATTGEVLIQPFGQYPTPAYPAPTVTSSNGTRLAVSTLAPANNVTATVATATITLKSSEVISAITGTASGATITVNHSATSVREVLQGDRVHWATPSTINNKAESNTYFGRALEIIADRKITLATVTNGQTVIINGIVFTAHTNTTTKSTRTFSIVGTDTQDADELCACINDPIYGLKGFVATNATGTITLAYDGDIVVTGSARIAGTVTTAPGSRIIKVKLGY